MPSLPAAQNHFTLTAIKNLFDIFLRYHGEPWFFQSGIPIINPIESFLLAGGLITIAFNFRKPSFRLLSVFLLIFILPVILIPSGHPLQFLPCQISFFLISSVFLARIMSVRGNMKYVLPLLLGVLYFLYVSVYFTDFEKQGRSYDALTNKDFPIYLNQRYGESVKYLSSLDFEVNMRTLLGLKSYYSKNLRIKYVSARFSAFWYDFLAANLPETDHPDIKFFDTNPAGYRFPSILVTVPVDSLSGKTLIYFDKIAAKFLFFQLNHSDSEYVAFLESGYSAKKEDKLQNTILKSIEGYFLMNKHNYVDAAKVYLSGKNNFVPGDFIHNVSICYKREGDMDNYARYRGKFFDVLNSSPILNDSLFKKQAVLISRLK